MKFEDDDLKDGKLWAALQKEIDRDLAEKESGETFQEELADIEDSIEFESKETKSEDHIPDETANLSNLRSVLEATERAKDEEAKQKMKQTKVEPVTQDIEIPEFTEEEEEIEETPAETKTESEPEEVMVDDDLIINDPFADEDDLLGEEKTETKGSEKEVLGDQVEAAMERLVSDTVGHIPMPEIDDEDDDYDDYEDDDEEYIPHGAKPQKKKGKGGAVIAVAAVAVIAVGGFFYGSKMFHYQNYFFNGTTINGVDCSDMTAKEAETKIKEQAANYTLNVKFKDNDTKSVSGKDIDYTYAGDGSVESVLKKQNSFLWFLGNGGKEKDSQVTMQYSQEKLDAVIDEPEKFSIRELLYTSSNPKVATVSRDGTVRAVSKGTCRIDIRAADGGPAEASVLIHVQQNVKCVYIINQQMRIPVGGTGNVICSVYPETANNKTLFFDSSNSNVAEVTQAGAVTGKSVGEAQIWVQATDGENIIGPKYICMVKVEEEGTPAWNEMFPLPQGCRWDYRIPAAIYTNLCYIWNRLKPPTGNEEEESLEEIVFLPGYATHIREVQEQINALERNIDKINDAIDWINPYYVEHREFLEKTPVQKDINRWILFCADMKAVLDGEKDKLWPLSLAGQPLAIRQNDALQYLCIREEK